MNEELKSTRATSYLHSIICFVVWMELELPGNVVGAAKVCKSEDMDCLPLHCIILAEIIDHRMHRSAVCRLVVTAVLLPYIMKAEVVCTTYIPTTSQKSALTSSIARSV